MSNRSVLAVNEHGDPNCPVVDLFQPNPLINVDPGDQFWLTVPVASELFAKIGRLEMELEWLHSGHIRPKKRGKWVVFPKKSATQWQNEFKVLAVLSGR